MLNHEHRELQNAEYVVFVDSARRYVDYTNAVCDLLGYTRDEMLQKKIDDVSYDSKVRELFELYLIRSLLLSVLPAGRTRHTARHFSPTAPLSASWPRLGPARLLSTPV